MAPFRVQIDDAFVKDKAIVLVLSRELHLFQCLVSFKMVGIPDSDGVSGFLILQCVQDVLLHAVVI